MAIPVMPKVINLRGRTPRVVPEEAVYIGGRVKRSGWDLQATKWVNPFRIIRDGTREEVIVKYRRWLLEQPDLMAALPELRGRDLPCWCAPRACHGDVLLWLANDAVSLEP
jgi:hypothetical protein